MARAWPVHGQCMASAWPVHGSILITSEVHYVSNYAIAIHTHAHAHSRSALNNSFLFRRDLFANERALQCHFSPLSCAARFTI